ncbi:MAG: hypothetical protein A3G30_04020 [Chlamydiae bacterium RIFCSPLOWO2_12_FULL_49_12]|nr:MAG: hypothetical protein A3D18_00060 [Chlamydiae bacterium RIFCSPHIGHO2_02_FULL_49_29]OGN64225.1 MAG: hypothetical protein A3E26_06125 [Chlamydiae bacterium RIFCSPHIGHO2_12_FULL_49_32]OGN71723.1 MAG: hypothetical protein A3G30_04020 [Chlamydiae bacterium RIFCSPLOWO2_12_FULL_49_12]
MLDTYEKSLKDRFNSNSRFLFLATHSRLLGFRFANFSLSCLSNTFFCSFSSFCHNHALLVDCRF